MRIEESRIISECYADTIWASFVVGKSVRHELGSQVAKAMIKLTGKLAIGIIDNDKKKPSYFSEFKEIDKSDGLQLLQKPKTQHFIIVVDPAIEKWILSMANAGGVKHSYTFETLKQAMKKEKADQDNNLKNFLNSIKQKNPKGVSDYKKWIQQRIA